MSHREKNLLEAFNASAASEKTPKKAGSLWRGTRPSAKSSEALAEGAKAGGPFASVASSARADASGASGAAGGAPASALRGSESAVASSPTKGAMGNPRASSSAARTDPRLAADGESIRRTDPVLGRLDAVLGGWRPTPTQRLIAFQSVLAIGAFLLGRFSVGEVSASEEHANASQTREASLAPAVQAPPQGALAAGSTAGAVRVEKDARTSAERALRDPANEYTIKLCEYAADTDENLVQNTQRYLDGLGLPACAMRQGSRLYVLVGAAARKADLDRLLAQVKSMNGPPPRSKKAEFFDAYVVTIDRVFDREP